MEAPSPKPAPRKEYLAQRLKHIWRFFLISNLALGAYMFATASKRDMSTEKGKTPASKVQSEPIPEEPEPVIEEPVPTPIVELMKERTLLHEEEKRELFEWMLEEKRKIKPKDRVEKKRIDEEKAILKQFIRAKSIPDI